MKIESDLLRGLIVMVEDFDFTPEQSAWLAPRLLDFATLGRDSNDAADEPAVLSAIRTGASMLDSHKAGYLRELLEPGHPIDTSIVALKMLGRIFEAQPPTWKGQHANLASDVQEIAKSALNRKAVSADVRTAARAQLAVLALASMASEEAPRMADVVREMGVSWFTEQTARELRGLRRVWATRHIRTPVVGVKAGGRESIDPQVLDLLDAAIRELGMEAD